MATVSTEHIWLDERGVAWVDDTNTNVLAILLDHLAHGLSPEEIAYEHYGRLSLAETHAALANYYDHQAALDAEIARQVRAADEDGAHTLDSPGRRRLLAQGKLP
jgi:uncharacterized protein (DUF433 family)